jgi:diguanylate cyclase (GGDEF)-like protein
MSAERSRPVERDDFLAPAPLFRYGPWALMIVGLLLSACVLVAALWRIEVGRHGEYEKAFNFASATATAVRATTTQVFALLQHVTASLQAVRRMPDPPAALQEQFAASFGLRDGRIRAFAVDTQGRVLAASPGSSLGAASLRHVVSALPADDTVTATVLPAISIDDGPARVIPVVYPLLLPGGVSAIVYLVDAEVFTGVFGKVLNGKAGWLRLDDRHGKVVFEVHRHVEPADTTAAALAAAARDPQQAMHGRVDYASNRLLLATDAAEGSPLVVNVGLNEAAALEDLRQRVAATWTIFGVSMLVVLSLVTITSVALRKFAIKETHLRRLATVDILTGLPNRRSFHHLLSRAVDTARKRQQVFGLMFVDLDNFKDVNDSMGHEAGDELLQRVGALLVRAVRQGDCVCRLGGDEFTVLLANLRGADEARSIGQRVLDLVAQPQHLNGVEVRTRATIGVALMPQHATTMSDLMRFADTAMYRAKQDGKSICLIYDPSMAAQALFKAQRARELTQAIANDQLFLEYQPKFCLHSGRITGHEALVRWQHPQRGLVGPGDFIALAEESGLIVDLGQWVLERAVRQVREWHDAGGGWQHVAINVSALQLRSGRFPACVHEALTRHGVDGSYLQLELTESSLVVDAEQARALVRQVHAMGSSVAVDDFGTGYSSLAALQQFNIDYLKIDRGFVREIASRNGEEICRTVVSLAHGLKMRAVAEGVETVAQRDILRRLGCDEVQGFLYARPLPADEVLRRARDGAAGSDVAAAEALPAPAPLTV